MHKLLNFSGFAPCILELKSVYKFAYILPYIFCGYGYKLEKNIKFKLNKLIIFELFKWVEKFIKQKFTWHQRTREQTENIGKNIFI